MASTHLIHVCYINLSFLLIVLFFVISRTVIKRKNNNLLNLNNWKVRRKGSCHQIFISIQIISHIQLFVGHKTKHDHFDCDPMWINLLRTTAKWHEKVSISVIRIFEDEKRNSKFLNRMKTKISYRMILIYEKASWLNQFVFGASFTWIGDKNGFYFRQFDLKHA